MIREGEGPALNLIRLQFAVTCAHGVLPVPAPGTVELLRGVPTARSDVPGELTTPTGAAVLTTLADAFGRVPEVTIERIGYGAGRRDLPDRANVLRVLVGESVGAPAEDTITVLETEPARSRRRTS